MNRVRSFLLVLIFSVFLSFPSYASTAVEDMQMYLFMIGFEERLRDNIDDLESSLRSVLNSIESSVLEIQEDVNTINMNLATGVAVVLERVPEIASSLSMVLNRLSSIEISINDIYDSLETVNGNLVSYSVSILARLSDVRDTIKLQIQTSASAIESTITVSAASINSTIVMWGQNINSAIASWSQKIIDKIDELLTGYENSDMAQANSDFDNATKKYEAAEEAATDTAVGWIYDARESAGKSTGLMPAFFPDLLSGFAIVNYIMNLLFMLMQDFVYPVTVALSFVFIMMMLGYHRYRG